MIQIAKLQTQIQDGNEITLQECVDILEECEIANSINIGSAVVFDALHPTDGRLIIVNTICGRAAKVKFN